MEIEKKFDDKQINEKKRKSISTRIPSQSQHKLPRTSPSQQKGKHEKQGNQNTHPQKEVGVENEKKSMTLNYLRRAESLIL